MKNELTDKELDTYSRQIVLSDIGYEGQLSLKYSKICIVGIGGLGAPSALKLTGMGIGLECFMDGLTDDDLPVCGVVGVHPSILGIISSVQVSEAVRVLTGQKPKLHNKLFYIDLRKFEFNLLDITARDTCNVCGLKPDGPPGNIEDRFY
ncbi:MAG: hypothetical protein KJN80_09830, partial [Deltaproteobacteria bacterium]|nr:hypothetical protein [Deltaproteobacteria bacterium]